MNEITYFLGAGASYQSMPLVNNFGDRFNNYLTFLRITLSHRSEFIKENRKFIDNIGEHLSFDTYFKKLFHQNSDEIVKYKALLLYYFIFEHLCPLGLYNLKFNGNFPENRKKFNIDPRYDSLIAGLLKPVKGQCQFYSKINIITWNYDHNILNAIRNFMFYPESIGSIIGRRQIEKNVFIFNEQIRAIHLNGFIRHDSFNDSKVFEEQDLIQLFEKLIERNQSGVDLSEDVKDLSFAWENMKSDGAEPPKFINSASEAVKNSHSVIVIGYSFPLYNRLFDQLILSKENLYSKTIYLRDPRNTEIQEVLFSDFGVPKNKYEASQESPELNSGSNCDSFFVPNQIFQQ